MIGIRLGVHVVHMHLLVVVEMMHIILYCNRCQRHLRQTTSRLRRAVVNVV